MLLKQLLKEAFQSSEEAIEYLKNLASTGELDKAAIDILNIELMTARRKMIAAKVSPEKRAAAAAKAKATRAQNALDMSAYMKKSDVRDSNLKAADQRRKDNNLLPLSTDDYSQKPDPKYYEYDYQDRGGFNVYKLKDQWRKTPVAPATVAKYWGD
tara:strand:+ start:363 stop:830 length:468 start_codon:yes stop_codon:yes gene_type:complete